MSAPVAVGPRIETLMLADYAEAIDGKLYVMGGGFTALRVQRFDRPHRCALAAVLRVPPEDAGRPLPIAAHVERRSGEWLEGWSLEGELRTDPPLSRRRSADRDGAAVLAGPVELHLTEPAPLVLRFAFAGDSCELDLDVLAA